MGINNGPKSKEEYLKLLRLKKEMQEEGNEVKNKLIDDIDNTNLSVERVIELILQRNDKITENDVIMWLREELKSKRISAKGLYKIKEYLDNLEEKMKRNDDNTHNEKNER